MTIIHTPWSAVIHAGLAVLGYCHHRQILHTGGIPGLHPLAVGPGLVGLVEPCVSGLSFFGAAVCIQHGMVLAAVEWRLTKDVLGLPCMSK